MKRLTVYSIIVLLICLLASGCGGGSASPDTSATAGTPTDAKPAAAKPHDPVTLSIYQESAVLTDDEYNRYIADPVKKKYPYITLNLSRTGKGSTLEDLVAAGTYPDVFLTSTDGVKHINSVKLGQELSALIKSNKFDLTRFIPSMVNVNRFYGKEGETYAIPWAVNFPALYYNKDIFDKFGVPYPKDAMTWDDVIALGAKVDRVDGGTQYYPVYTGMSPLNFSTALSSEPLINEQTHKAQFNNDVWRQVFDVVKKVTDLPENKKAFAQGRDVFLKERTLAMLPSFGALTSLIGQEMTDSGKQMNWDWVSAPTYKSQPKLTAASGPFLMMVGALSKNKQEAFEVITAVTGDENQVIIAKDGQKMSALKTDDVKKNFGADNPLLKGKNIQGVFKVEFAPLQNKSEYDDLAWKEINANLKAVVAGKMDINTALRDAEEAANAAVKAAVAN